MTPPPPLPAHAPLPFPASPFNRVCDRGASLVTLFSSQVGGYLHCRLLLIGHPYPLKTGAWAHCSHLPHLCLDLSSYGWGESLQPLLPECMYHLVFTTRLVSSYPSGNNTGTVTTTNLMIRTSFRWREWHPCPCLPGPGDPHIIGLARPAHIILIVFLEKFTPSHCINLYSDMRLVFT